MLIWQQPQHMNRIDSVNSAARTVLWAATKGPFLSQQVGLLQTCATVPLCRSPQLCLRCGNSLQRRVLTVSFHKFGDFFFPGTGDLKDVGEVRPWDSISCNLNRNICRAIPFLWQMLPLGRGCTCASHYLLCLLVQRHSYASAITAKPR
jgi:hypothetical protein